MAEDRNQNLVTSLWDNVPKHIASIKESQNLGKPVPSAFSVKIQRKLASTVPPRPIVNVAFEAAYNHLESLCRDVKTVAQVMNYHGPHSLKVWPVINDVKLC